MKRALVLGLGILLCVGTASLAQTFSGEWTATVKFDLSQGSFSDAMTFYNTLLAEYNVGGWTFGSATEFAGGGWASQLFSAGGSFGAYSFDSSLALGPGGSFDSWAVDAGITMGGVTFGALIRLDDTDSLTLILSAEGSTDVVDLSVYTAFGDTSTADCDFTWQNIGVLVQFPFCCADVVAILLFDGNGFDAIMLMVHGLEIENIPWLAISASLEFELESKTLTLAPDFDFGEVSCDFDLYFDLSNVFAGGEGPLSSLAINEIRIDGISLGCSVAGVEFLGVSYWGSEDKPSILEDTKYWEAVQISTSDDGCCGLFSFDAAVFFDVASANLFDVAAIETNMSLVVSAQFTFLMGLEIDVRDSLRYWTVGFDVVW